MARPPAHIALYIEHKYPRPKVDPEWLQGCYEWLIEQPGADVSSQKFLENVESQLLRSHFEDSMLAGTGLPIHIVQSDHKDANTRLSGPPILVEIAAITEIAHSAYQLDQIRTVREDRTRAGQIDDDEGEGDLELEGEGPMPKYPRGMLKFELSDGTTTLSAIEYRSIPEIVLGKIPLGFKILLKNPLLRHGIAFLEPSTIELIGHQTEDREVHQPTDFARGLRVRMGLPLPPADTPDEDGENAQQPVPQAAANPGPVRSPLREISPPLEIPLDSTYNDDANLESRRRKLPPKSTNAVSTPNSTTSSVTLVASGSSTTNTSHYFSNPSASSSTGPSGLNLGLTTAQASQAPAKDSDDDEEDNLFSHFDNLDFLEGGEDFGIDENLPPPLSTKQPAATSSSEPTPRSSAAGSLVAQESIEIISFTPTPASTGSRPKDEAKGKEEVNRNGQSSSAEPRSDDLGSSVSPPASLTFDGGASRNRDRTIKPLPKTRKSLPPSQSSQPHRSQSQPLSPPPPSQIQTKEVIDLDSSSSSSSPKVSRARIPRTVGDDHIEILEGAGDLDDEEQYDKENVPVMTRHVRRRIDNSEEGSTSQSSHTGRKHVGTADVLELSDED